jgi:hypothetical protein
MRKPAAATAAGSYEMEVPVGAGSDATRVASYNPWVALYWLTTGKTVGGQQLYPERNRLDRQTALSLWTKGSAWFSGQENRKGALRAGEYADLAVLSNDYFSVPGDAIKDITSLLTIVDGRIVHGAGEFAKLAPPLPPPSPDWSPITTYGGYQTREVVSDQTARACVDSCGHGCGVHGHAHQIAWTNPVATSELQAFWGVLGCSCFAF